MKTHYCLDGIDRRSGLIGSFIVEPNSPSGALRALSPVFGNPEQLFDFMHNNGWRLDLQRHPLGCSKEEN